jgi:hypothetical protein
MAAGIGVAHESETRVRRRGDGRKRTQKVVDV